MGFSMANYFQKSQNGQTPVESAHAAGRPKPEFKKWNKQADNRLTLSFYEIRRLACADPEWAPGLTTVTWMVKQRAEQDRAAASRQAPPNPGNPVSCPGRTTGLPDKWTTPKDLMPWKETTVQIKQARTFSPPGMKFLCIAVSAGLLFRTYMEMGMPVRFIGGRYLAYKDNLERFFAGITRQQVKRGF